MTRELLLVRHALPERVEGAVDGADPGLTDVGRDQASAMATWLADEPIVAVHASPARRALQTAEPLAEAVGASIETHDGLLEYDWGSDAYVPFESMRREQDPRLESWREMLTTPVEEHAGVQAFIDRVVTCVLGIADRYEDGSVAIVSHGGTINAFVAWLLGSRTVFVTRTEYAGVSRILEYDVALAGRSWVVESLNEAPYLRGSHLATAR